MRYIYVYKRYRGIYRGLCFEGVVIKVVPDIGGMKGRPNLGCGFGGEIGGFMGFEGFQGKV